MKKDRNCNAGIMPAQGMMVPYPMMGPSPIGVGPVMMSPSMNSSTGCGCGGNNNNGNNELNRLKQQVNNLERRVSMLENNQPTATPYNNYSNYSDSNVQMI